jgi:hypothetical protein
MNKYFFILKLDAEAAGEVAFNNEPIIPDTNAGTKENPILVSNLRSS